MLSNTKLIFREDFSSIKWADFTHQTAHCAVSRSLTSLFYSSRSGASNLAKPSTEDYYSAPLLQSALLILHSTPLHMTWHNAHVTQLTLHII